MSQGKFTQLIKSGKYKEHSDIRPGNDEASRKDWHIDQTHAASLQRFRHIDQKVMVWEFYDMERDRVIHYHRGSKHVLFEGSALGFHPYSTFSLIHSGVDNRGLSEVGMILEQQRSMNQLLTLWKRIAYLQIPKILFDAGKITTKEVDKVVQSILCSWVPVETSESTDPTQRFSSLFFPMPEIQVPNVVLGFIKQIDENVAWETALAEAARGQVAKASTATEMQIINTQLRTRMATRLGHLNEALEDVAKKAFHLNQRYMRQGMMVQLAGDREFEFVRRKDIRTVDVDFRMVPYNPMQKNPAVMLETLQRLLPILAQAPNINIMRMFEEVVIGLGLPTRILKTEQEVKQEQEAAAAQQQQMMEAELQRAQGGAAASRNQKEPTDQEPTPETTGPAGGAQFAGDMVNMSPRLQAAIQKLAVEKGMSPPR
jgi:hypothetical protein